MSERQFQIAVAQILDLRGFLWCHVPNEGKRKRSTGGLLKAQGLKAGVPDVLIFDRPACGAPGSAFELKVGRRRLTDQQAQWVEALRDRGWVVSVERSIDSFLEKLDLHYPPRGYPKR